MRGIKNFNFPAFDAARDRLLNAGWEVISPADLDRKIGFDETAFPDDYDWIDLKKIGFSIEDAIDRDVAAIKTCDAIYLLSGWQNSKGAVAEKGIAEWLGLDILYQEFDVPWDSGDENVAETLAKAADRLVSQAKRVTGEGSTVVNDKGGKQSYIAARFDCLPPECLRLLAQCLGFGARKYGKENWRKIDLEDNIAHCLNHLNEFRRGDTSEPHLVNALARLNFALAIAVSEGVQSPDYHHPEME
jgi:hypothetical protein